jgi:hypothetical protein
VRTPSYPASEEDDSTGEGIKGQKTRPYGGHFMVLVGVSDDGKTFQVNDGGRNVNANIHTITADQLSGHTDGFWTVENQ